MDRFHLCDLSYLNDEGEFTPNPHRVGAAALSDMITEYRAKAPGGGALYDIAAAMQRADPCLAANFCDAYERHLLGQLDQVLQIIPDAQKRVDVLRVFLEQKPGADYQDNAPALTVLGDVYAQIGVIQSLLHDG